MPNRVIREALLDSPRYWSVTDEARLLFIHLLLLADDFGLVSLAPVFIRRRAFDQPPSPEDIEALIEALAGADLIRVYEDDGARYAYIPRFRQQLRIVRPKHPMPPPELFADDENEQRKFNINKEQFKKSRSRRLSDADQMTSARMSEGKGREVEMKGIETNRNEGELETEGKGKSEGETRKTVKDWAQELRVDRRVHEDDERYQDRILQAIRDQASAGYRTAGDWLIDNGYAYGH